MSSPALPGSMVGKRPGAFRMLHTADWHLGRMLGERDRVEEHRRFLGFLLRQVREHGVDVLVVAGDIFDSANPPQSAVAQYYDFLSDLFRQGSCQVVLVSGNHDSPSHLEAPRRVLRALGARIVGSWPSSPAEVLVPLPNEQAAQVVVAAVPFLRDRDLRVGRVGQSVSEIQRELVAGIQRRYEEVAVAARPWMDRGIPLVATGHLTVVGATTSESEREIHVGGLGAVGGDCFPETFSYVALGHLHRPQAAGGRATVRYAGSPIPLSFGEATDAKELRLLEFAEGRLTDQTAIVIPRTRPLVQVRTRRAALEVDLAGFQRPEGELPAWLEVIVEDAVSGENLHDRVQDLVRGREMEVIRVLGRRAEGAGGLAVGEASDMEGIADLLGDPRRVFARRLEEESGLTEEERAALGIAFQELLALHADREREGTGSAARARKEGRVE